MQLAMYRILQLSQVGFTLLILGLALSHIIIFFIGRGSKLHHIRKHHLPQICEEEVLRLNREIVILREKLTEALRRNKLYMEIMSVIRHASKKEDQIANVAEKVKNNIVGGGR